METPSAHFTHSLKSLHLNKQYNQAGVVYVCKSLRMHLIFRLGRGREEEICSTCGVNDAIIVRTHCAHKTITFFSLDYLNIISASCPFDNNYVALPLFCVRIEKWKCCSFLFMTCGGRQATTYLPDLESTNLDTENKTCCAPVVWPLFPKELALRLSSEWDLCIPIKEALKMSERITIMSLKWFTLFYC